MWGGLLWIPLQPKEHFMQLDKMCIKGAKWEYAYAIYEVLYIIKIKKYGCIIDQKKSGLLVMPTNNLLWV